MNKSGRKESVIEYFPEGAYRIPEAMSPPVKNKSFTITAEINMSGGGPAQGVIATSGGKTGGYAIYLKNGYASYVHNLYNENHYYVRATKPLPEGYSELTFVFEKNDEDNGGIGRFVLNGEDIGSALIPETTRNSFSIEDGFDIGVDDGSTVTDEYQAPFRFTGELIRVVFDLDPDL